MKACSQRVTGRLGKRHVVKVLPVEDRQYFDFDLRFKAQSQASMKSLTRKQRSLAESDIVGFKFSFPGIIGSQSHASKHVRTPNIQYSDIAAEF